MSELPLTRSNPDVEGARNNALYGACMRQAHNCKSLDELLAFARHTNGSYSPPMEDSEVMTVAHSAWGYTQRGQNRMGQHGAYFPIAEVAAMYATKTPSCCWRSCAPTTARGRRSCAPTP